MIIYPAEKRDGLADAITSTRIVIASSIVAHNTEPRRYPHTATASVKHPNLFRFESVMVSSGANGNDDVFDSVEMWKARHTPNNTRLNLEHDESKVIGHISDSRVVSADKKTVITSDTSLPDELHIIASNVIYLLDDATDRERMTTILREVAKGEWYVSMECLFTDYDYALLDDNDCRIVARAEDSAFLTKHLRAYGGTGEYDNKRVLRILRDISFCGEALVRQPANSDSVIFASQQINNTSKGTTMSLASYIKSKAEKVTKKPRTTTAAPVPVQVTPPAETKSEGRARLLGFGRNRDNYRERAKHSKEIKPVAKPFGC